NVSCSTYTARSGGNQSSRTTPPVHDAPQPCRRRTMARTLPKSVIESKPLHAVAGAGDLAVEKIRVLSKLAAERVSAVESDPVAVSNRIQEGIEQRAETLGATLRDVSADVRVQLQDLSVKAQQMLQTALLQANQTYDALAERGRDVVVRLGGLD